MTAPDPDLEQIVSQTLRYYRGWRLEVSCSRCGTLRTLDVSELHDRYGDTRTLRDVVERLVCRQCRGLPTGVELRHHLASRWIVKPD
jgi:hypothetical protein